LIYQARAGARVFLCAFPPGGDGVIDVNDIIVFVEAFIAGCD
jgi:hypothetical protein